MLCVYIGFVRVANDHLNCLEVEVGVTLVGASVPSAHYTHKFKFTNVTPIIRTHNILTSHNPTHNNPLEPLKKPVYYYGFVYHKLTSENNYGNFVG